MINNPKVEARDKNVRLLIQISYKRKLAGVYAIHWCELHQWLSAAKNVTCTSYPLLQFA